MRNGILRRIVVAMLLPLVAVGSAAAAAGGAGKQAVEQASKQWVAACNAGDFKAMGALYAEDAQILPPNEGMIAGRAEIESFWAAFCDGTAQAETTTIALEVGGDLVTHIGTYRVVAAGTELDRGKFIEVWKRSGGVWRISADIWNSDRPLPE